MYVCIHFNVTCKVVNWHREELILIAINLTTFKSDVFPLKKPIEMATAAPKDVEMTAPPEAVSVGPDYSSIASSMALVRLESRLIHCLKNMSNTFNAIHLYKFYSVRLVETLEFATRQ